MLLDGRLVLLLCSNNYLGLADHPQVRGAAADAAMRWGAGAGASRLISGNMEPHRRLEERLAAFKGYEAALLFGSGYLANTGAIAALAGRGEVVFSDELNHASIVDGCRLSRAETFVYRHADVDHLAWGLAQARGRGALIVTDGVFSMDGDVAPLGALAELARRARLPADGRRGARHRRARPGRPRQRRRRRASARRSTWSSARSARRSAPTAPTPAPAASSPSYLVNTARPFIFSTAPPPPALAAALAALELLESGPQRVERLRANAATLRGALAAEGLEVGASRCQIVPIEIGDAARTMELCERAARARRLRPGDPPADRPRGLLAAALHGDGHAADGRAAASGEAGRRRGARAGDRDRRRAGGAGAARHGRLNVARCAASSSPAPAPRWARRWSPRPSPARWRRTESAWRSSSPS